MLCRPSVPANSPLVFDVQLLYIPGGCGSAVVVGSVGAPGPLARACNQLPARAGSTPAQAMSCLDTLHCNLWLEVLTKVQLMLRCMPPTCLLDLSACVCCRS